MYQLPIHKVFYQIWQLGKMFELNLIIYLLSSKIQTVRKIERNITFNPLNSTVNKVS